MTVLLLRPEDHRGLLTFAEGVKLMHTGFENFAKSRVNLSNPRTRTNTPDGFRMTVHQGVTPSMRGACTSARGERVKVLPDGRQKYVGRGRPVFCVFNSETADLLMIMIGEPRARGYEGYFCIAGYHTACAAMVGTNMMARPDAKRVGVLGSGGQAVMHLAALAETRSVLEAAVYSPTRANRERFAREMTTKLGFPVRAAQSTDEVVEFSEILLVCTNSNVPVLDGAKLRPGTHVTSIVHSNKEMVQAGVIEKMRQEIDDETLRRADLIVTANMAQEELDQPEVLYGAMQRGVIRREKVMELKDIFTGNASVSEVHRRGGLTFFKNPGAWGIGAGALFRGFYDRARERGVGLPLDIEGQETLY
jgi:ornithine cyclodeaminase/alanine dehydrogenase-like protein (mu-crystallin family)